MASATDVATARQWVGSTPDDSTLGALIDVLGGPFRAARGILGQRLADLLSQPATFAVAGAVSVSSAANITALREQLKDLARLADTETVAAGGVVADPNAVVTTHTTRRDLDRSPLFGGCDPFHRAF